MLDKSNFFKHSAIAFSVRVVGALIGLVMTMTVTRTLPVAEAGMFFLAIAVMTVLASVSTLGLTAAFIRFIAGYIAENNWNVVNGVFTAGLKATFITASIVSGLLYFSSDFLASRVFDNIALAPVLKFVSFTIPFYALFQLIGFAFQGLNKSVIVIFIQTIFTPLFFVLLTGLSVYFGSVQSAKWLSGLFFVASMMTFSIGIWQWYRRQESRCKADYSRTLDLKNSALPLWIAGLMMILVQWSGQLIASTHVSAEQLAVFAVAQRLSLLTTFVLIAVNLVAAPRFASCSQLGNTDELRSTSIFCSRIMVFFVTPVLLFMLFFAEFLMGLFGDEYTQGAYLLQIMVFGQFINVVCGSVGFLLRMTGHEKDLRNTVLLSGPPALLLGFLIIPIYGVTGAAISTAVGIAAQNLLSVYMVKKRLGFNTLNLFN